MLQSRRARVAALMALLGVLGCAATAGAPDGTHYAGLWPVGLGSGILIYARPSAQRLVPLALLLGAVILAALALGGYPWDVSIGYAVGITSECLVVHQVLTGRWGGRRLSDDRDLVRFAAACLVGALVGALVFGLTSAVTDFGRPGAVAVAVFIIHLTSQLILLGLFMEEFRHPGFGGRAERSIRWSLALAMTLAAFVPTTVPSLVFLVLPLIGWTALRAPMREALWQLLVVCCIASDPDQSRLRALRRHRCDPRPLAGARCPHPSKASCWPARWSASRSRWRWPGQRQQRRRGRPASVSGCAASSREPSAWPSSRPTRSAGSRLFNPGAEALLGYSEEELLGRTADMFFTDEEIARHAALLGVPARPDARLAGRVPARDRPTRLELQAQGRPGPDPVDERRTDHRQQPPGGRLPQHRRRHHRAGRCADRPRDRACRPNAGRSPTSPRSTAPRTRSSPASATSCAHRSRTSSATSSSSSTGRTATTTAAQHEALGRIDANSHRLLELIDNLLTLSSLESLDVQLAKPARRPARGDPPLGQRDARRRSSSAGSSSTWTCPREPVVVLGDEEHLERMVSNLATNAVKFTPDGGRITLRVRADGPCTPSRCRTPAWASPSEERSLLFNRFYRATHAQTEAVKRQRPRASRSPAASPTCTAPGSAPTSTPGQGSTFTVTFDEQRAVTASLAPPGRARRLTRLPRAPEHQSELGYFYPSVHVSGLTSALTTGRRRAVRRDPTANDKDVSVHGSRSTGLLTAGLAASALALAVYALRARARPDLVARWWPATALVDGAAACWLRDGTRAGCSWPRRARLPRRGPGRRSRTCFSVGFAVANTIEAVIVLWWLTGFEVDRPELRVVERTTSAG